MVKTAINFMHKDVLLKIAKAYTSDKKRKEEKFMKSIAKEGDKEDRIAEFAIMGEIDDFLFRASRIGSSVFFMDEKKEKEIKIMQDEIRMKVVKLQNSKANAYAAKRNMFIEQDLSRFIDAVEEKMAMFRKPLENFVSLMYN